MLFSLVQRKFALVQMVLGSAPSRFLSLPMPHSIAGCALASYTERPLSLGVAWEHHPGDPHCLGCCSFGPLDVVSTHGGVGTD